MNAPVKHPGRPLGVPPGGKPLLSPEGFARLAAIAEREAGLAIPAAKQSMVESRLSRRLRATGIRDLAEYLDFVERPEGAEERDHMIAALTTNVSNFFRENHHFETLSGEILPELLAGARRGEAIRIWSAGCSTGQEPYTIAMTLLQADQNAGNLNIKILATDVDRNVLARARDGRYDAAQIEGVPGPLVGRSFDAVPGTTDPSYTVRPEVRRLVTFRPLNLIQPWPMTGKFDVIFCRNVLIYFSEDTQRQLWPRFEAMLKPGGWLFLGHSERIHEADRNGFETKGITTYRRRGTTVAERHA